VHENDPMFVVVIVAVMAMPILLVAFTLLSSWWQTKDEERPRPARPAVFDPEALAAELGEPLISEGGSTYAIRGLRDGRAWGLKLRRDEGMWRSAIAVDCDLPKGIRVRPEGFFGAKDPEVGDPAFDSVVDLRADPAWLSAVFDARSRSDLLLLQGRAGYSLGHGTIHVSADVSPTHGDIVRTLEAALRLGGALELRKDQIPEALLGRARQGFGTVRLLAALRLLAGWPDSIEARELVERPPGDLDEKRAFAALARAVTDPDVAEARILSLLSDRTADVRRAALVWLAEHGTAQAVQPVREAAGRAIKEDANRAIEAIKARLADTGQGSLSLADEADEEGRLALADGREGALSLTRKRGREPSS
jgi:hypothetical protein